MKDLFTELRRRNIFKVGVAYAVVAWLVMQIGALIASAFAFPPLIMHLVIFFLLLGFPLALVFAWAFELTPEGLRRSADVEPSVSDSRQTGRMLDFLIIGVMGLVIAVLLVDRFVLDGEEIDDVAGSKAFVPGEKSYDSIAVLPFVNMSDDRSQEFFRTAFQKSF